MKIELLGGKNEQKRQLPQVTHPQRLEMNFEENETAKSYFSCSLSSLLGFWVALQPFRVFSIFFLSPGNVGNSKRSPNTHGSTRSR